MPRITPSSNSAQNAIQASSQQSRFHTSTLEVTSTVNLDIDLKNVTLTVGQRDLLDGCDIKLKEGKRYALIGR